MRFKVQEALKMRNFCVKICLVLSVFSIQIFKFIVPRTALFFTSVAEWIANCWLLSKSFSFRFNCLKAWNGSIEKKLPLSAIAWKSWLSMLNVKLGWFVVVRISATTCFRLIKYDGSNLNLSTSWIILLMTLLDGL